MGDSTTDSRDMSIGIFPSAEADFMPLSRSKKGQLYRKHILTKGSLRHPATKQNVDVNDDFFASLVDNFNAHVCDIVQVPLAGPSNEHTEDPTRNIGEVVGLEMTGDKLYAVIDARDANYADKLGQTLLGASAMIHPNYEDAKSGKKVGPTLLHVCVTNRPYITELDDYELIAATADNTEDAVMYTPEEDDAMTREQLIEALKTEHGIDVTELQASAEMALSRESEQTTLTEKLYEIISEVPLELSGGDDQTEIVLAAVQEIVSENLTLSAQMEELEIARRESEIDALVAEGRILPAQRDAFLELSASNPDLFSKMVPEEPLVKLSDEQGTSFTDSKGESFEDDVVAEIQRYTASDGPAAQAGYIG